MAGEPGYRVVGPEGTAVASRPSPRSRTRTALLRTAAAALAAVTAVATALSAQTSLERLSRDEVDVTPPAARVSGAPGAMAIRQTSCQTRPDAEVRRRIIDIAVQEWAFFGFGLVDHTVERPAVDRRAADPQTSAGRSDPDGAPLRSRRRFRWLNAEESSRVAASIAGYWAVTPEGGWILERQNEEWNGPAGVAARWRDPWSAAFISWVICESGLGETSRFRRAVAHHVYIDQAIRARDGRDGRAAFVAYDVGEQVVEPGDLLCSGRRPSYRTLADRRRQMGEGARTHCDFVVKVDVSAGRMLAIGGNVRGAVSLKLLPAVRDGRGRLQPAGDEEERAMHFAHLKLQTPPVEADAFDRSGIMNVLACSATVQVPSRLVSARLSAPPAEPARC